MFTEFVGGSPYLSTGGGNNTGAETGAETVAGATENVIQPPRTGVNTPSVVETPTGPTNDPTTVPTNDPTTVIPKKTSPAQSAIEKIKEVLSGIVNNIENPNFNFGTATTTLLEVKEELKKKVEGGPEVPSDTPVGPAGPEESEESGGPEESEESGEQGEQGEQVDQGGGGKKKNKRPKSKKKRTKKRNNKKGSSKRKNMC